MNVAPEKKFLKTWLWKFFAFIYIYLFGQEEENTWSSLLE